MTVITLHLLNGEVILDGLAQIPHKLHDQLLVHVRNHLAVFHIGIVQEDADGHVKIPVLLLHALKAYCAAEHHVNKITKAIVQRPAEIKREVLRILRKQDHLQKGYDLAGEVLVGKLRAEPFHKELKALAGADRTHHGHGLARTEHHVNNQAYACEEISQNHTEKCGCEQIAKEGQNAKRRAFAPYDRANDHTKEHDHAGRYHKLQKKRLKLAIAK